MLLNERLFDASQKGKFPSQEHSHHHLGSLWIENNFSMLPSYKSFSMRFNFVSLVFWPQLVFTYLQSDGLVLLLVIKPVWAYTSPVKPINPFVPLSAKKIIRIGLSTLGNKGSCSTTLCDSKVASENRDRRIDLINFVFITQ